MTDKNDSLAPPADANGLTRRSFLRSSAAAGSALYLATSKRAHAQSSAGDLNIAIVGCGAQGNALMNASRGAVESHGINYVAVCDIWDYNREAMANRLTKYGFEVEQYVDIEEMLAKSPEIDAVLIATPDFMHAPHSRICLEAGKMVYCEKMMSNTLEAAADMVRAQRETGKLLQIGHQRRSNPRYLNVHDNIFNGSEMLGRVTHCYGQWNRAVSKPLGAPEKFYIDQATLTKYGYNSMEEFRNWRWYKKYGGGPISDLGAHQIDLFNWMFNTTPKSVIATGGVDYYDEFEMPDNAMTIYEYDTPNGVARAYYQVLTTTSSQGFYEKFMGTDGTVSISENPNVNQAYREARAEPWDKFADEGFVTKNLSNEEVHHKFWEHPKPWYRPSRWLDTGNVVDVRETAALDPWELAVVLDKPPHQPHLENFFEVCKGSQKQEDLNCPVTEAYKTAVTVLKINDAIAQGSKVEFAPDEFTVS